MPTLTGTGTPSAAKPMVAPTWMVIDAAATAIRSMSLYSGGRGGGTAIGRSLPMISDIS